MKHDGFKVRDATLLDVPGIYNLGAAAPELNVGGVAGRFPYLDELARSVDDGDWVVLETPLGAIGGFCCSHLKDGDRTAPLSACIVYIYVAPVLHRRGFAQRLLETTIVNLRAAGVEHAYSWAHPESGAVEFFERQGFSKGKPCVWMDIDLNEPAAAPPPSAGTPEVPCEVQGCGRIYGDCPHSRPR